MKFIERNQKDCSGTNNYHMLSKKWQKQTSYLKDKKINIYVKKN